MMIFYWISLLIVSCAFAGLLFRLIKGPTIADRVVEIAPDDFTFGGNFNRIKNLAASNGGLYLSPDFSDFGAQGAAEVGDAPLGEGRLVDDRRQVGGDPVAGGELDDPVGPVDLGLQQRRLTRDVLDLAPQAAGRDAQAVRQSGL